MGNKWLSLTILFLLLITNSCRVLPAPLASPYSDYSRIPFKIQRAPNGLLYIATGGSYFQEVVWVLNPAEGNMKPIQELAGEHVGGTIDLTLGSDGNVYALTTDGGVWSIDGITGDLQLFKEGFYRHISFTPDGNYLVLLSGPFQAVRSVEIIDVAENNTSSVQHNLANIYEMVISQNSLFLVGYKDKGSPAVIEVLDVPTGRLEKEIVVAAIREEDITGAQTVSDNKMYVITTGTDLTLHVVDISQGEYLCTLPIPRARAFSVGSEGMVYVVGASNTETSAHYLYTVDPQNDEVLEKWWVGGTEAYSLQNMIALEEGKAYLGIPGAILLFDLQQGQTVETIPID